MAVYCIDDGGDGSQTNTTQSTSTLDWSKADASVADLIAYDSAAFTTPGNIIFFGDDTNDPNKGSAWTLTLPTSGAPVVLVSADRTLSTPTYKVGTGNQLSGLAAYGATLDGSHALYGIRIAAGGIIGLVSDANESGAVRGAVFAPAANSYPSFGNAAENGSILVENAVIDLTADGTSNRTDPAISVGGWKANLSGLTFINAAYRTGTIFAFNTTTYGSVIEISGSDFSGFTNATLCEMLDCNTGARVVVSNCLTAATWAPFNSTTPKKGGELTVVNCGPAYAPEYIAHKTYFGESYSSRTIYRTGGAEVESVATSWLITTTANANEHEPFYTPWRYGKTTAGSKTFDLFITNDTGDFDDSQVWLEVQSLSTSSEAISAVSSDHRVVTAAAAAQTDDVTSTWNGSGPSFTYKQKLSVSATVGEAGLYRFRVAVGLASIASGRNLYVDPKVTVT